MLNRFLNSYRQFMYGRYGSDFLNVALCIFAIVTSFLANIRFLDFLRLVSLIALAIVIYRTLSKDISKRQTENMKFLRLKDTVTHYFYQKKNYMHQRQTYKFFKCPNCQQKIRIPKGRGTVSVSCPKCGHKFIEKT